MFRALVVSILVAAVAGLQVYQNKIPNGKTVPDPCDPAKHNIWPGVGHWAVHGGGPTNPFGKDFAAADHTWTKALCQKDSDGDGRTNGQELGDPECTWTTDHNVTASPATGHPGVCEPLGASKCSWQKGKFACCGNHACADWTMV